MDKSKPTSDKNGKKQNVKEEEEPKVAFNGNFEQLMDLVAPPIKPKKKLKDS